MESAPSQWSEDPTLVARMAGGDTAALRQFYDLHSAVVYALCVRIVGDSHEAEDVLIDVFHEFWRRSSSFDAGRGSAMSLLMTLARSRAIDRRRSRGKLRLVSGDDSINDPADTSDPPAAMLDHQQQAQRIRKAMRSLEPQQRQAIECSFYDGMSHSEIAAATKKPLGTIKTYIRQGLLRLREALADEKP